MWDDHITVVFFPGVQLATGKKGRLLYDLVRVGSQPALGRLPAITSGIDIMSLVVWISCSLISQRGIIFIHISAITLYYHRNEFFVFVDFIDVYFVSRRAKTV